MMMMMMMTMIGGGAGEKVGREIEKGGVRVITGQVERGHIRKSEVLENAIIGASIVERRTPRPRRCRQPRGPGGAIG